MKKEKMKTIGLITLGVLAIVLLIMFVIIKLIQNGSVETKESQKIMNNFEKYYNSKERTIIYYASTSCGYCSLETPILEVIASDYDLDYLYVDSSKLGLKQRNQILKKLDIEQATPTTVIVEKGKVIDKQVGFVPGKEYVEFFKKNQLVPEDAVYSAESNLTYVTYDEYENIINSSGINVVVLGQTTCSHCIAIKPALNEISKEYNLVINYLNLTDMTSDEYTRLVQSLKDINYDDPDFISEEKFGTPLTLIIKDGKLNSYISGERSKSQLVKSFKKAGLI